MAHYTFCSHIVHLWNFCHVVNIRLRFCSTDFCLYYVRLRIYKINNILLVKIIYYYN
jgi:hypothetical protein